MEPEGSNKSQLSNCLKLFLKKRNRIQPFIGLGSIIECVNVSAPDTEALFLCEVCVRRLSKTDMQNHIVGSRHRFNYIKACHPHLVSEWQANSDLPKLAWPLMELAKKLENEEGPGDFEFLEVEDSVYQMMANQSESYAITLVNNLRERPVESETACLHYPVPSEREVLFALNQARESCKSFEKASQISKSLLQEAADVPPSFKSTVWSQNKVTPHVELKPTPKPSVLSGYRSTLFDGYYEEKPLIGLARVVEFRSEDGTPQGFLCHCCRIKFDENDVNEHVVSGSHLINYLTETHADEMEGIGEDPEDNYELLCLAKKVEEVEGRGELEVIHIPGSHCWQLTGKSYHWCLKMLSGDWANSSTENVEAGKRTYFNRNSVQQSVKYGKKTKRVKGKKKMKKIIKTVFNVSLPLSDGELLLQGRTSFSADNLLESSSLYPSGYDPAPLPDADSADCMLECDSSHFTSHLKEETSNFPTSLLHQDQVDPDSLSYEESSCAAFEDADDFDNTENNFVHKDYMYNRQHESYEHTSNETPPVVTHTNNEAPYNFHVKQGGANDYNSASDGTVVTAETDNKNMCFNAGNHNYQQPHLHEEKAWGNVQPGSMWEYEGMHGQASSYLDTPRTNMQYQSWGVVPHSGGGAAHFYNADLSQMQACTMFTINHFQAVPHNSITQPANYTTSYPNNGVGYSTNYNFGSWLNPVQHYVDPTRFTGGEWSAMQPNACDPTWTSIVSGACSNVYYGADGHV